MGSGDSRPRSRSPESEPGLPVPGSALGFGLRALGFGLWAALGARLVPQEHCGLGTTVRDLA